MLSLILNCYSFMYLEVLNKIQNWVSALNQLKSMVQCPLTLEKAIPYSSHRRWLQVDRRCGRCYSILVAVLSSIIFSYGYHHSRRSPLWLSLLVAAAASKATAVAGHMVSLAAAVIHCLSLPTLSTGNVSHPLSFIPAAITRRQASFAGLCHRSR